MSESPDLNNEPEFSLNEDAESDQFDESWLPPNFYNFPPKADDRQDNPGTDPVNKSAAAGNQEGSKTTDADDSKKGIDPAAEGRSFRLTFQEIAGELAYNYFTNSFGDDYNMEIANCDEIFKDPDLRQENGQSFRERFADRERVRNILVIGAGAPYDTYKAIPRGEGLIEEIKKFYENEIKPIPFLRRKFEQEELEIKDITGEGTLNFENYLYLLSKLFVTQTDLREKIKDMVGFRYPVSLFYEIVAHMLKHSFIDVVVNFNFEETLDQIIEEEVGLDNYHNIIYDGNCVGLDQILVDGRLKMPVYIKPHGTFSHKSTLRFTNRHYFDLPNDIKTMLEDLFSGKSGDKKPIQRVNLILVGFAIQSVEFNRIIDDSLPRRSVIYHIDHLPFKDGEAFFKEKAGKFEKFATRALQVKPGKNDLYKPLCTANFNKGPDVERNYISASLGELFSVLWRVQNDFFQKTYKPRSIARHEITSYLLYDPAFGAGNMSKTLEELIMQRSMIRNTIEECPKYFRNRVMVELFILLNRSNGIIDIAEILKGRTGMFYNKYVEMFCKRPKSIKKPIHSIYELIQEFAKGTPVKPKALLDIKEYNTGPNIFILQSAFDSVDLSTLSAFQTKLEEIRGKLQKSLQKVAVPKSDPQMKREAFDALKEKFLHNWVALLENAYTFIKNHNTSKADHELIKLGRAITLFYRLLKSKVLSERFKINLMYNHNQRVFSGKKFVPGESVFENSEQTMLNDLFRLLAKSWSHHYFVIDPAPSNPVHHLWESFSKRKVIHTNLARTAEFNYLFLNKKWDVLLTITETGSLMNFLHHLDGKAQTGRREEMKAKLLNKHFVFICSYESIRQLYPAGLLKKELIAEHKKHLSVLISNENDKETYVIDPENITVLTIPFNQHNQHFSIFLQGLSDDRGSFQNFIGKATILTGNDRVEDDKKEKITYLFDAIGSIYIYRSGFSNSIDPLYIGLADNEATNNKIYRDQIKLIKSFVTHLNRAFKYERFSRKKNEQIWEKPAFIKNLQENWEANGFLDVPEKTFLDELYYNIYPKSSVQENS